MIDPAYVRTIARYNRSQNGNLYGAANMLSDDERRQNRSAFFKSIHATFNHLLWADKHVDESALPGSQTRRENLGFDLFRR